MKIGETYYGGKSGAGVYQAIINNIPFHHLYFELFLGQGAIMRYKLPTRYGNVGFDLDAELIQSWNKYAETLNGYYYFENRCAIAFLENFERKIQEMPYAVSDFEKIFIYLDPPYRIETRNHAKKQYKHELTDEQHIRLLDASVKLDCNIAISCYDNDLYAEKLAGWRKITFKAQTRRGLATETLYMNYHEPKRLHDYRYLGDDFRERERIRRKISRHVDGLKRLPEYERQAIIEAINKKV